MELISLKVLRGPNQWAAFPVLEAWVDLGRLEDFPSNTLPGFNDRIMEWLPSMIEHRCSIGERGGFFQRLRTGTWMGHVLEHIVIEVLDQAGMHTGFGQTRSTRRAGVYRMVLRASNEEVGRVALAQGHALISAALNDEAFDVPAAVTAIPGMVFSGSVDGHLRGYSMADGKIAWDFDTIRSYDTVNKVEARGGSLDGCRRFWKGAPERSVVAFHDAAQDAPCCFKTPLFFP